MPDSWHDVAKRGCPCIALSGTLLRMADEGMSEDRAKALAEVVQLATGHAVEVQPEDDFLVVEVRRTTPGDVFTLRDEADWRWLEPQIRAPD